MSRRISAFAVMLLTCLLFPHKTYAGVIIAWDWNDGTTQGWTGSTAASNVDNKLLAMNNRNGPLQNGSLQIFSPNVSNVDLRNVSTISFDLSITSYTITGGPPFGGSPPPVTSPGDLTVANLGFYPLIPGPPIRLWNLNLSNLAFGQTRTFNLSMQDASGEGPLADVAHLWFLFSNTSFSMNTSSALLDNFVVSDAVSIPEPSSLLLLGTTITIFLWRIRAAYRGTEAMLVLRE